MRETSRNIRDRGRGPVSFVLTFVVTAIWAAAGVKAILSGEAQPFIIASPPFGLLCGYHYGIRIIPNRAESEE